ncbi:MAG: sigma 54-interacting transcriptional regulator [Pseudomonadota bacterium]
MSSHPPSQPNQDPLFRYKSLLDSLNVGFALMDMDFGFLDVNENLLKMTGAPRRLVVGHHTSEFYSPRDFERLKALDLPLQKQRSYQFEFFVPTMDGGAIPALFNISINYNESGQPETTNATIIDIREQKRIQAELEEANRALKAGRDTLEDEKKKLEAILFGIGDSVTVFDLERNIILSNPKGLEVRGQRRTPLLPLIPGLQREISLEVGSEQRRFLGQVEAIRDRNGDICAFAEIFKDVTHQIRLEEKELELSRIKREIRRVELEERMIGISPAMQKVFDLILRCAEVDSSVLVLGETGVGKELAARAIHAQSSRKEKPFVAVNCGALPETLLESELFGHVKGSFTGAVTSRPGLFREAEGGTLFLDEVGDLSPALQVKLLRALQEKEIRPVGGSQAFQVDVRVITATNRDLKTLVEQGRFRHDLYYRVAVIPLIIPPLRDRKEDILALAEHFIRKHGKKLQKVGAALDRGAFRILQGYSWPGNIRELENCVEHALAMSRGAFLTAEDLPLGLLTAPTIPIPTAATPRPRSGNALAEEMEHIKEALRKTGGHRAQAARELGMSRTTLWRKMLLLGLDSAS